MGVATGLPDRTPAPGVLLVDWDNVLGRLQPQARGVLRLSASIAAVGPVVLDGVALARAAHLTELDLLLYGGWNLADGRPTNLGEALRREFRRYRRRIAGIAVRPQLRLSTFFFPGDELLGLFRPKPAPPRQKLVDVMLAVDAIHVAERLSRPLWVASDDDDLVPAIAEASSRASAAVTLLRDSRSPNHAFMSRNAVRFGEALGKAPGSRS